MKIFLLIIALLVLLSTEVYCQETENPVDTIILKEITIFPFQKTKELKPISKKPEIHVSGKGKSSIISKVQIKKSETYKLKTIEFFFNYKWSGVSEKGFYIRPLVTTDINLPVKNLLNNTVYYISKNINESIIIDISKYNIVLKNIDLFYIGIELINVKGIKNFEDFNVTMQQINKSKGGSLIKGECKNCTYSEFDLDDKMGLTLKYNISYSN